jgi:hypothetical protein
MISCTINRRKMVYVKSLLAGVVAVVLGVPAFAVILILGLGFKVIELSRTWPSSPVLLGWVIASLFSAGFFWKFRRASR